MTEPTLPPTRPRIPWSDNSRRVTSFTAAIWSVVGAFVAISKWSAIDPSARIPQIMTIIVALCAGVGAAIFSLRGTRVQTMLLLALAASFPTYFLLGFNWAPLALILYLMMDPLRIASQNNGESRRRIWITGSLVVVVLVSATWYQIHFESATALEAKRAQRAFQQMTVSISKKVGVPTSWLTPVRAGTSTYADGSKATLWVPKPSPKGERSNCFYVDQTKKNTAYGFTYFGCDLPKASVILQRQHAVVVGFLNDLKTKFVTVTSDSSKARIPVTFGYFIMPSAVSAFPLAKFTITYTDPDQATCRVSDLSAPGSASTGACTIA